MVAEKSLKGNNMQYLCKLTILIALLVSQILGQQVGPPEFTSQDSTNMLTWKIPNIKSAEVNGYSIDPAKIEISVKTKEKLLITFDSMNISIQTVFIVRVIFPNLKKKV